MTERLFFVLKTNKKSTPKTHNFDSVFTYHFYRDFLPLRDYRGYPNIIQNLLPTTVFLTRGSYSTAKTRLKKPTIFAPTGFAEPLFRSRFPFFFLTATRAPPRRPLPRHPPRRHLRLLSALLSSDKSAADFLRPASPSSSPIPFCKVASLFSEARLNSR